MTLNSDLEMEIYQNYQQYINILHKINNFKEQDNYRIGLIHKVNHYIELLKCIQDIESKYKSMQLDLKQSKHKLKNNSNNGIHKNKRDDIDDLSLSLSQRKYNQLLTDFNILKNDNKNMSKNLNEMKLKLQKQQKQQQQSMNINGNDIFQQRSNFSTTPYLSKIRPLNISNKVKHKQQPAITSPKRNPNNNKLLQSTPTLDTPNNKTTMSSKSILLNLSTQKKNMRSPLHNKIMKDLNNEGNNNEGNSVVRSLFDDDINYNEDEDENDTVLELSFTKLNKSKSSKILLKRKVSDVEVEDEDQSPIVKQSMSPIYKRIKQTQEINRRRSLINSPLKRNNQLAKSIFG
ncbi:hypothetical protein CANARDRAFT_214547 [[Candida] arabinofermentans NRRL YB-2248]|uniref:Uncharacterized protein n=1 Tax=[Candida] arabinofermentans NRRL YB-2248 TaxID=983967 RepID=A0A1E4SUT6_9ASCO|nr:hypothetical protein CANARDRAFT_214547 [[Candida] arabinofermentans NRRL YB-2248]